MIIRTTGVNIKINFKMLSTFESQALLIEIIQQMAAPPSKRRHGSKFKMPSTSCAFESSGSQLPEKSLIIIYAMIFATGPDKSIINSLQ